jgi:hypothetical protein
MNPGARAKPHGLQITSNFWRLIAVRNARTRPANPVLGLMAWEKKTELVRVHLTPSDMKVVTDWQKQKRIGSRAEAARQLIFKGLLSEGALPDIDE